MVEPRYRVQDRGEALVAYCWRYAAMLSELRFKIVTRSILLVMDRFVYYSETIAGAAVIWAFGM